MIEGIRIGQTWDYTCKKDKDNPTVWKLGTIDSTALLSMSQEAQQEQFISFLVNVVRLGLKGWKNFQIEGKEVEYRTIKENMYGKEREVLDNEVLAVIPADIISELGTEIIEKNQVSEEDQKN